MSRPHVVIIGAGFGGVYTARYLLPYVEKKLIDVTIINRTNYFLFTPLLHEVATGGLRPTSVSESLREIFRNTRIEIYQDDVKSVDTKNQNIITGTNTIKYDYLVIASGAETNYYNIPGAKENTLPLKSLIDAVNIRAKIINAFEKAVLTNDETEKKKLLSFVVVGGGATGVETVAEIAEFVSEIKNKYYKKNKKYKISNTSIFLVSSGNELLKPFDARIRKQAEIRLKEIGVNILLNTQVTSVEQGILNFPHNRSISAETIIWAAGVIPTIPKFIEQEVALISDRIKTNRFLAVESHPNIFVLGDSAGVQNGEKNLPHPMLAQVAVNQAKVLAENIIASVKNKPLSPFIYKSKGDLISFGHWYAAGDIYGIVIHGRLTWWVWRTVYLFTFNSWQKRIRIAFEWTIDLFFPRDITKIL